VSRLLAITTIILISSQIPANATPTPDEPKFERIVIDNDFPGAYQVEVADVNGDKKPDIIAVGGGTCAWYKNPSWKKRIISTPKDSPDIITSATADLDGDGKAEVAIGYDFAMNTPKRGKLLLAVQGKSIDDPWTFKKIANVGSIHRIRWGEFDGDASAPELVVAPIFGQEAKPPTYDDPASIAIFQVGHDPKAGEWRRIDLDKLPTYRFRDGTGNEKMSNPEQARRPVLHAIEVKPNTNPGEKNNLLTADNLGVGWFSTLDDLEGARLVRSVDTIPGQAPKRGCSEVHYGRFAVRGWFLATIEPWHGTRVVIHRAEFSEREGGRVRDLKGFFPGLVIDDTLDEGHALWVADVDGDGTDEVFAGHRGKDHRVSMYKFDGKIWNKMVLDKEIAAQDLRGGDINGDGKPDVVAVGGSTHNVILYRTK
jgi:hypothetical protein